jgi:hypothetical protein
MYIDTCEFEAEIERLVNRYYDPATDQLLSVDPLVKVTGQSYAFTGDDPLNDTDPLGLVFGPCSGGSCAPTIAHQPVLPSPPKQIYASSPYRGPSVTQSGPTEVIGAGAEVVTITSTLTITGRDANPNISVEANGTLDVSAGSSSAQISPDGAINGLIGVPGEDGIYFCTSGGGGICFQAPPATYDVGPNASVTATITAELGPGPPSSPLQLGEVAVLGVAAVGCGLFDVVAESGVCPIPGLATP